MEKKPRKRKSLNIEIDTKNVDVSIKRDLDGNTTVDVDTPKVDIHASKNSDEFVLDIEIDDQKEYEFVANGKYAHMPKGTVWKITGEILRLFLKKGIGRLKD
jgi:hypothetical protein